MGFWKDVAYDMQMGMSKEKAIKLNAAIKYGTPEERKKAAVDWEIELKLSSLP